MNHEFYTDRLSAYFDMELKNEEFVIVDEHVKQCTECQQLLAAYEKLNASIEQHAELDDTEYWEKSAQKIEAALSGETKSEVIKIPQSSYKGLWWKLSGVAASIAFLLFIAINEKDITEDLNEKNIPAISEPKVNKKIVTTDSVTKDAEKSAASGYRTEISQDNAIIADDQIEEVVLSKNQNAPSPPIDELNPKFVMSDKQDKLKKNADESITSLKDAASSSFDKDEKLENAVNNDISIESETSPNMVKKKEVVKETNSENKKSLAEGITTIEKQLETDNKLDSFTGKIASNLTAQDSPLENNQRVPTTEVTSEEFLDLQEDDTFTSNKASKEKLVYWQNSVVSNQLVLETQNKQTIAYKKATKKNEDSGRQAINFRDQKQVYKEIFEGFYNIALLTEDSTERNEAIAYLKKHARDLGFDYSAEANNYLYKYDSIQTILKRNQTSDKK